MVGDSTGPRCHTHTPSSHTIARLADVALEAPVVSIAPVLVGKQAANKARAPNPRQSAGLHRHRYWHRHALPLSAETQEDEETGFWWRRAEGGQEGRRRRDAEEVSVRQRRRPRSWGSCLRPVWNSYRLCYSCRLHCCAVVNLPRGVVKVCIFSLSAETDSQLWNSSTRCFLCLAELNYSLLHLIVAFVLSRQQRKIGQNLIRSILCCLHWVGLGRVSTQCQWDEPIKVILCCPNPIRAAFGYTAEWLATIAFNTSQLYIHAKSETSLHQWLVRQHLVSQLKKQSPSVCKRNSSTKSLLTIGSLAKCVSRTQRI